MVWSWAFPRDRPIIIAQNLDKADKLCGMESADSGVNPMQDTIAICYQADLRINCGVILVGNTSPSALAAGKHANIDPNGACTCKIFTCSATSTKHP